jgi:hypothetical protein
MASWPDASQSLGRLLYSAPSRTALELHDWLGLVEKCHQLAVLLVATCQAMTFSFLELQFSRGELHFK